jgi:hypothetical protein
MIHIGGGKYAKICADFCVPQCLTPQEDGTIHGTMQSHTTSDEISACEYGANV